MICKNTKEIMTHGNFNIFVYVNHVSAEQTYISKTNEKNMVKTVTNDHTDTDR